MDEVKIWLKENILTIIIPLIISIYSNRIRYKRDKNKKQEKYKEEVNENIQTLKNEINELDKKVIKIETNLDVIKQIYPDINKIIEIIAKKDER